ncbi:protocadherin alpha-4-like [Styela clava]
MPPYFLKIYVLLYVIFNFRLCVSSPPKIKLDLHVEEETMRGRILAEIDPLVNKDISSRINRKFRIISQNILSKNTLGAIVSNRAKRIEVLKINEKTGTLRLSQTIDREKICPSSAGKCMIRAQIVVLPQKYFQLIETDVTIDDVNDNTPTFPHEILHLNVSENWSLGEVINLDSFQAKDNDIGNNSKLEYSLSPNPYFELKHFIDNKNSSHLQLFLLRKLDYEDNPVIEMKIVASDLGIPSLRGGMDLKILVLDVNDNYPVFEEEEYSATLKENASPQSTVAILRAHDADSGLFGAVRYYISSRNSKEIKNLVRIDEITGVVSLKETTDRENHNGLRVLVGAMDLDPMNPKTGETWLVIYLEDVNDNSPTISIDFISQHSEKTVYLSEFSPKGTYIARVSATDSDSGDNGKVKMTLTTKVECRNLRDDHFILSSGGFLENNYSFDRESCSKYKIVINACDHGTPEWCSDETVTVIILDENEVPPKIHTPFERVVLKEDAYLGTVVTTIIASDADAVNGPGFTKNENDDIITSRNGEIFFSIVDDNKVPFTIGKKSGKIRLMSQLDREVKSEWKLKILARDGGLPPMESYANIIVEVDDVNDNSPQFVNPSANNSLVYVNVLEKSAITKVKAIDSDSGINSKIIYSIFEYTNNSKAHSGSMDNISMLVKSEKTTPRKEDRHYFIINPNNGELRLNFSRKNLEDSIGAHYIRIRANDHGIPLMYSDRFLKLIVGKYPSQSGNLFTRTKQLFSHSVDPFMLTVALGCSVLFLLVVAIVIAVKCRSTDKNFRKRSSSVTTSIEIKRKGFKNNKSTKVTFYDEIEKRRQKEMKSSQESLDSMKPNKANEAADNLSNEAVRCNQTSTNISFTNHSDSDSGKGDSDLDAAVTSKEHIQLKQLASRCGEHCRIYGHSDMCWMPVNESHDVRPILTQYNWEKLKPRYIRDNNVRKSMAFSSSSLMLGKIHSPPSSTGREIYRPQHRVFERRHSNPTLLEEQPHPYSRNDIGFTSPPNYSSILQQNNSMVQYVSPPTSNISTRTLCLKRSSKIDKMTMNSTNIVCNLDTVYETESVSHLSSEFDLSSPQCNSKELRETRNLINKNSIHSDAYGRDLHENVNASHINPQSAKKHKSLSMEETEDIINNIENLLL